MCFCVCVFCRLFFVVLTRGTNNIALRNVSMTKYCNIRGICGPNSLWETRSCVPLSHLDIDHVPSLELEFVNGVKLELKVFLLFLFRCLPCRLTLTCFLNRPLTTSQWTVIAIVLSWDLAFFLEIWVSFWATHFFGKTHTQITLFFLLCVRALTMHSCKWVCYCL